MDEVDLLYARWRAAQEAGGTESGGAEPFDALCARHPEHADALRRRHQVQLGVLTLVRAFDRTESEGSRSAEVASAIDSLRAHGASSTRYEIRESLGEGGMGEVREAWDTLLERLVAYKVIRRPDLYEHYLPMMVTEMRISAALHHPGVAGAHDAGVDSQGRIYFTMPIVRGRNLNELFEHGREGRQGWDMRRMIGLFATIAEIMAYVHEAGIVHRDLKPANIRVNERGEPIVMDWGLARRRVPEEAGQPGGADGSTRGSGTLQYASPEQWRGERGCTEQDDIYSLGVIMYEFFAGCLPHKADAAERVTANEYAERLASRAAPTLAQRGVVVPREINAICARALERDPSRRYATMRELAADLRAYLGGHVVRADRTGPVVRVRKLIGRNQLVTVAVVLIVAICFLSVQFYARMLEASGRGALVSDQREFEAAKAALADGRWQDAKAGFRALSGSKYLDRAETIRGEASALLAMGDLAGADELLKREWQAEDLERDPLAMLLRARIKASDRVSPEEVRAAFERARALGLDAAGEALADGFLADSLEDAQNAFQKAIAVDPNMREAYEQYVQCLFLRGRWDECKDAAGRAETRFPDDPAPRLALMQLAAARGNEDEAREILAEARIRLTNDEYNDAEFLIRVLSVARTIRPDALFASGMASLLTTPLFLRELPRIIRSSEGPRLFGVNLGGVRDDWLAAAALVASQSPVPGIVSMFPFKLPPAAEARRRLREREAEIEDPFALHVLAADLLEEIGPGQVDLVPRMLQVMRLFERSAQAEYWMPFVSAQSRVNAMRAAVLMLDRDPTARETANSLIDLARQAAIESPDAFSRSEVMQFADVARQLGRPGTALSLLEEFRRIHPDDEAVAAFMRELVAAMKD